MFWLHFRLALARVEFNTTGWLCVGNVAFHTNRMPERVANWFYWHMSCIAPRTIRKIGPSLTGSTGSENIRLACFEQDGQMVCPVTF